MRHTIFRSDKGDPAAVREETERHHYLHYIFKLKWLLPWLRRGRKLMEKFMIKDVTDVPLKPENTTIRLLADLFSEEEMKKFYYTFKGYDKLNKADKAGTDKCWEIRETQNWYWVPRFAIRFMATWILQDTHYRAFYEYMARRFQHRMNDMYNPELKQIVPFYIWKYDGFLLYFLQWKALTGGGKVSINLNPEIFIWRDERPTKERENILINSYVANKIKNLDPELKEKFMVGLENFIMKLSNEEMKGLAQYSWQNDKK